MNKLEDPELKDKIALVTGASQGIGLEISKTDGYETVSTIPGVWIKEKFNHTLKFKPSFNYSFSDWVDGTFYISHKIMETHTTNKKDESTLGFDLRIYFESRSSN